MNNEKKKEKNKKILLIPILVGIAVAAIIFLKNENFPLVFPEKKDASEVDIIEVEPEYITETCFDGSKELNPVLFDFPFQKTENRYIKNKDLVKHVSEKRIEGLQKRATQIAESFFGLDNNTLVTDYTNREDTMKDYFLSDAIYTTETGQKMDCITYIANYLKQVSEANVQVAATFDTDKSLVFEDGQYFVRGLLTLTVFNAKENFNLESYIPYSLEKGKTYNIVLDIGLIPESSRDATTYKVSTFEFMDCQEINENGNVVEKINTKLIEE